MGVFICLFGLLTALFGHMDETSAAGSALQQVLVTAGHAESPVDSDHLDFPQHCVHQGQCSVQAVLPAAPVIAPQGSSASAAGENQLCSDRAILPLRHPPKTTLAI